MSFSSLKQTAAVHCRVLDYLMLLVLFCFVLIVLLAVLQDLLLRRTETLASLSLSQGSEDNLLMFQFPCN